MATQSADSEIYRDFYSTTQMRAIFEDGSLVQYWLDVEAALARAQAGLGIIPDEAALEISARATAAEMDLERLRVETNLVGYPILPLVRQLAALCDGQAGHYVHWGATTQDIMDTGNVLQLRSALDHLEQDLDAVREAVTVQARLHRETPMAGRTHGQQALPITFGLKLAVWVDELNRHRQRLDQLRPRLLRCQFAGAAGTLASLGESGWAVHQALASELDLAPAVVAWHTARDGFGEFVSWCGLATATLGKMAREIATLQKTEYGEAGEAFEPGKGSSSTMPQKRNPILCETVVGLARLVSQQVPAMLAAMMPEHERAMGEWHMEWDLIPHTCQLTAAAFRHSRTIFEGLAVHPQAMAANLTLTKGSIVAEAVMMALAKRVGRQKAHDLVYAACLEAEKGGGDLRSVLLACAEIHAALSEQEIDDLLDPANYTGLATFFVDAVVGSEPEPNSRTGVQAHQVI